MHTLSMSDSHFPKYMKDIIMHLALIYTHTNMVDRVYTLIYSVYIFLYHNGSIPNSFKWRLFSGN